MRKSIWQHTSSRPLVPDYRIHRLAEFLGKVEADDQIKCGSFPAMRLPGAGCEEISGGIAIGAIALRPWMGLKLDVGSGVIDPAYDIGHNSQIL